MGANGEGTIYIPLAEFWTFVEKYNPAKCTETLFGVPRVVDEDIVIDYAFSTEDHPSSWAEKPKPASQWEKHRKEVSDAGVQPAVNPGT
jgi:hypothetical protein